MTLTLTSVYVNALDTLRRHSCLLRAADSASSRVSPGVRLSSLSLADLALSWNLEPPSTVIAVVFAISGPFISADRANIVFFH